MANKLSPQGYNITRDPVNTNPFWDDGGGNVPAGGTTGQVLTKRTDADYDTEWKTPEAGGSGLPEGGTDGDLLTKVNGEAEWTTPDFATGAEVEAATEAAAAATEAAAAATEAAAAEKRRAEAVEANIIASVGIVFDELSDYKTVTNGAIADLRAADSAEATARENADTALGGRIDGVAGDLAAYEQTTDAALQTLDNVDDRLETMIGGEATARIDADALLRQDLTEDIQEEAAAREAADAEIRQQIAGMSGIPAGGTTGQALVKASDTNFDVEWGNAGGGSANSLPDGRYNGVLVDQFVRTDPSQNTSREMMLFGYISPADGKIHYKWKSWATITLLGTVDRGQAYVAGSAIENDPDIRGDGAAVTFKRMSPAWVPFLRMAPGIGKLIVHNTALHECVETDPVNGGTTGQALVKSSNADYDWEWKTVVSAADLQQLEDDLSAEINTVVNAHTPTVLQQSSGTLTGVCAVPWIYVDADGTVHGGTAAENIPANWLTNFNNTGVARLLWRTWQPNGTIILHPASGNVYVPVRTALPDDSTITYTIPISKAALGKTMVITVKLQAQCGSYTATGIIDFVLTGDEIVCKTGLFRVYDGTSYYDHAGMGDFVVKANRITGNLLAINYGIMADFFNYVYALFPSLADSGYSWSITPTVTVGFALPTNA